MKKGFIYVLTALMALSVVSCEHKNKDKSKDITAENLMGIWQGALEGMADLHVWFAQDERGLMLISFQDEGDTRYQAVPFKWQANKAEKTVSVTTMYDLYDEAELMSPKAAAPRRESGNELSKFSLRFTSLLENQAEFAVTAEEVIPGIIALIYGEQSTSPALTGDISLSLTRDLPAQGLAGKLQDKEWIQVCHGTGNTLYEVDYFYSKYTYLTFDNRMTDAFTQEKMEATSADLVYSYDESLYIPTDGSHFYITYGIDGNGLKDVTFENEKMTITESGEERPNYMTFCNPMGDFSASDLVGEHWTFNTPNTHGGNQKQTGMGTYHRLILNEDGTGSVALNSGAQKTEFTWKVVGHTLIFSEDVIGQYEYNLEFALKDYYFGMNEGTGDKRVTLIIGLPQAN